MGQERETPPTPVAREGRPQWCAGAGLRATPSPTTEMGWQVCGCGGSGLSPCYHLGCLTLMVSPWQEWQTGKHGATFCCGGPGAAILKGGDAVPDPASRLRGSGPPGEFSFPPDGG